MKRLIFLLVFCYSTMLMAQPFGNVLSMDGTSDYVEVPDAFGTDFEDGLTIEAWINPCATNGHRVIASKWYCTGDQNAFFFTILNGRLRLTWDDDNCSNGSNTYQSTLPVIQTNQWQHVAVTHDSLGVHLYLNGTLLPGSLTTGSANSAIQSSTEKLRIGTYKIGSTLFVGKYQGLVDEVRIWDTKRTTSQISSNYLTSLSGTQTDLVGYYKMNITSSGNAVSVPNSATITGTAVVGTTVGSTTTPEFVLQDPNVISNTLGNDTVICGVNSTYQLDATTTDATYLWNDGSTLATKSVSTGGTFSVIITIGCNEYFDTVQVAFQAIPSVQLGNDTTLCAGQSLVLDPTELGATYLWQNGSTNSTFTVTQSGVYSVTKTINSCAATDAIVVSYIAPATVDLGPDQTVCEGTLVTLDATNASATYAWSTGAVGSSISVSQTDIYAVEVNHQCGTVADSVLITVNPLPIVNLGNDTTLCTGQTHLLNAAVPGATYLWQDGSTNANLLVSAAGSYSVTVTKDGCSTTDNITVQYVALPIVNLGQDQSMCQSSTVTLDATNPAATYLWSTGSINPTIAVSQTGVYSVAVQHYCGTFIDSVAVTVNPIPTVNLGNDSTLCNGESLLLNAGVPGATYLWQDGSTEPHLLVNSQGAYSVTATRDGCSATDNINISYINPATVNLGPNHSICQGESVTFDATNPSATYAWSTGSTSPSITVNQTGMYSVTVGHHCGTVVDSVLITVNPMPTVNLGNDTTLCTGQTLVLDGAAAASSATYLWQDGSSSANYTVHSAGLYSLATTINGCSTTDQMTVSYTTPATVNLGPDHSICQGESVTFDATNPSATYAWSTGSTSPSITVNQTGMYSVIVGHHCGTVIDSVLITVNPMPAVNLGNDTILCTGQTLVLDGTAASGATYLWQDGSSAAHLPVNSAGLYSLTTTKDGCMYTDQINVSYTTPASVNLGVDETICQGETLILDATNTAATYLWSTGASNPSITVNQTGTYSVDVLHYCGTVQDTVNVTVQQLPIVNLGNDTTLCTGQTHVLDANITGGTYAWQDGSNNAHFTVNQTGTYATTVTVGACSSTDEIFVDYTAPAMVNLGADQSICEGESVVLDATNSAATYLWSTGSTNATAIVSQTGVYSVEVGHYCGTVTDTILITVNALPVANLGNDTTLCSGETVLLNGAVAGATYLWQDGSTAPEFFVSAAGTYELITVRDGCTATSSIDVNYTDLHINLGPDIILCEGESIELTASSAGATYVWQDGSTNSVYNVTEQGVYFVQVNNIGCEVIDSIEVSYELLSKNVMVTVVPNCGFADLVINANPLSNNGSQVALPYWTIDSDYQFTGLTVEKRFTTEGSYFVEFSTNSGNCQFDTAFSVDIDMFDLPDVSFNVSNNQPEIDELIYFSNYSVDGLNYTWDFGNGEMSIDFEPSLQYDQASIYTVVLKGENDNCEASVDLLINVKEPVLYFIPNAFTPDGNQFNNTFMPIFTSGFNPYDYELRIFNRWGEVVFISNDPSVGWDGFYAGNLQESGVYVWEVIFGEVDSSRRISDKGTVTLIK